MADWNNKPAYEVAAAVRAGRVSAREVVGSSLSAIGRAEPHIGALLATLEERALARADELDSAVGAGRDPGALAGVPVVIKANIALTGVETSCGSRILEGWRPPYTATVARLLEDAGAVIVGSANMDEFAMGSSTENSAYHVTRNPWDTSRVPGGSSGGPAAAVAAGEVPLAMGSDTGGSIRQPAAFCGIVGVKPTYGRVSRYGLVAYASSLDQIGPLCRDTRDAALALGVIARHDPLDSTSSSLETPDYTAPLTGDVKGLVIGRPAEMFTDALDRQTADALETALERYSELGARVVDISIPALRHALAAYYIIAPSEASSNLARYDGVRYGHRTAVDAEMIEMFRRTREEGFGAEVKRRIVIGTYCLSSGYYDAWYRKAQQVRTLLRRGFDEAFSQCDVIATPTSPILAFAIGERVDDPYQMYLADICTIPVNLAGLPAMSLPCGFADGLPVGLQLIARLFDEATMLRAGHAYEQATEWHTRRPPLPEASR